MKRYHIWSIGCQMNAADSRRAAEGLERLGYRWTKRVEEADLVVLNTCVVRQSAEDKALGRLSSLKPLKKKRPDAIIVVMGCLVDDVPALKQTFPYVDAFLKPSDVEGLVQFVKGYHSSAADFQPPISNIQYPIPNFQPPTSNLQLPVSCHVPVIEGCDHFCTYCIVRLRRGREQSRPVDEIVEEVRCLVERGAREVTLLGQNVDAYGHDLSGRPDLADLLTAVHGIEDLWRIRFLTSHPADMKERFIDAVASLPKVCEHIEIPVQSGDDAVLKRMVRGYTVDQYRRLVDKIRQRIPGVSLATDVIVGFPGETEEQFMSTCQLLEEIRFDTVHVAAYSPRPGTAASRLPDDVPQEEKQRRRKIIEELQEDIAGEINQRLLGETVEVLVEEKHKGKWKGRTRTNKLVFFKDDGDWRGKLAQVKITWAGPWSMQGELA
ncbi:MAG: tRNA (N6-isopentenyl adenosine(37)-C2)-methylthiotransferase MiaB [Anaerolineales bacterium]|nr:tRNA (N6-isopentenyl adenosine(37)-C2)-methylthiotransferase MiaB [Anaerolineales bacterium]